MKDWEKTLIGAEASLKHALGVIDATGAGIALVTTQDRKLIGTLSDGDIRRALIQGVGLETPVGVILNPDPRFATKDQGRASMLGMLRGLGVRQLPIIEDDRTVVGLAMADDYLGIPARSQWVVIMAGGRGSRLSELTRHTPKPMLKVGGRPIIETIVMQYADQGFRNFYLAVNYKAEQIEEHFGNGSYWGLNIQYIRENMALGTGGALSLLPHHPDEPIVVSNADVLSKEDYGLVLEGHLGSGADATILVRDYEFQVPFGVVTSDGGKVTSIQEKPTCNFVINSGVYVLSPASIKLVPPDSYFDLPTLLEHMLELGMSVRTHHAQAYWLDIGRMPDYERANSEFGALFE